MDDVEVKGMAQLARNLAAFGSDKIVGKILRAALRAGANVARTQGAQNSRALGLNFMGIARDVNDKPYKRYGRIPKSIKVNKPYIPRDDRNAYRVNVVARGQRRKGIFANKAPHAHLIEYGFNHIGGHRMAGRSFLGTALTQTAGRATEKIRDTISRDIDRLRFPL